MSQQYQVLAKVVSRKGTCVAGHKVGDEFTIGDVTPINMYSYAFNVVIELRRVPK